MQKVSNISSPKDFPDLGVLADEGRLKLDKVLEIRETKECKEFRDWLTGIDTATDEEIKERIDGIRARIGNFLGGIPGKSVRLLISTGLGFIPSGAAISFVESLGDTFLLEKIFPASGPIAFINKMLPSAFELEDKKRHPDLISLNIEGKESNY